MSPKQLAEFDSTGAIHFPGALSTADIGVIAALFDSRGSPGSRLTTDDVRSIAHMLRPNGVIGKIVGKLTGRKANAVRAILLNKSPEANWRLAWHQDRTIAVEQRIDVDGFAPWSVKAGQTHVQPPHAITSRMITLRIHLDDVGARNAPLEVLTGSHRRGRLTNAEIDRLAGTLPVAVCLARAGDIWAYATAIVHRSAEQQRRGRRRVLQVDFSVEKLPNGLKWVKLA